MLSVLIGKFWRAGLAALVMAVITVMVPTSARAQSASWQPSDASGNASAWGSFEPYFSIISGNCTTIGYPAYVYPAPGGFTGFTGPYDELELTETAPAFPNCASQEVTATQDAAGYFRWVDSSGNLAPNPPSHPLFQVSLNPGAYIWGWEPVSLVSGTITDDLGDAFSYDDSNPFDGSVPNQTFTHYYVANVTNGIAKIDVKSYYDCFLTAVQPLTTTASTYAYDCLNAAAVPPPTLTISSGLGTTYHKDAVNGGRDANVAANGVTNDDTVTVQQQVDPFSEAPLFSTITCSGSYGATWNSNSVYSWNEQINGASGSGIFQPNSIGNLQWTPSSSTATDDISLFATDSEDGITVAANDYIKFHNPWENLIPDAADLQDVQTKTFPSPIGAENNGTAPIQATFTGTITGTVNFLTDLTAGMTIDGMANLGVGFHPSIGVNFSGSISEPGPTLQPHWFATPELISMWYRDNYLVDSYGTDGFDGTTKQSVDNSGTLITNFCWSAAKPILP